MISSYAITHLNAFQILDSRGNPTIKAVITLSDGSRHSAAVPSGASTGSHEAVELRDGQGAYDGKGVQNAIHAIHHEIAPLLQGKNPCDQATLDNLMITCDGTKNKSRLGANAILAVSMALMRAGAHTCQKPLWQYIQQSFFPTILPQFPALMVNVINGGKHAAWNFDIQEFILLTNKDLPSKTVRIAAEIFAALGKELKKKGCSTLVGDEGGYSPKELGGNRIVLQTIIAVAKSIGYENGVDYRLATDVAASEFYKDGAYMLQKSNEQKTASEMSEYYQLLQNEFHIASFEDPFMEDDWHAFTSFTAIGEDKSFWVVGDDHLVTNQKRIARAIQEKSANAVIIKPNQIGTMTETIEAINLARSANWKVIVSHRSGETEDAFIADLAYACGADCIKTGSMSRSDRLAKYNRLLEIEAGF